MNKYNSRINSLLRRMTISEKLGQLNQLGGSIYGRVDERGFEDMIARGEVGSFLSSVGASKLNHLQRVAIENSRLKIPLLFASDVIHGIKTIFPTPLAESCSWDTDIARRTAEVAAHEASALGVRWTFAPMVDIARDARWGRVIEGAGEDPYLGSLMAAARVEGFQGTSSDIDSVHMAACCKHFAGYGAAEGGRDYNTVQLSQYNLANVYLPPFRAAVDSGVKTVMTAFNDINGVPSSCNPLLTNRILRDEWKFSGVVVSDWQSILETVNHGYCNDSEDCAREALASGVDIDMASEVYIKHGESLVREGKIAIETIDKYVYNMLKLKFELGLFDNPYVDERREGSDLMTKQNLDVALESAEKSIVLLKKGILPIAKKSKVLLVGSLADNPKEMHGAWASYDTADRTVTIRKGLEKYFDLTYDQIYSHDTINLKEMKKAIARADSYDCIIAVVGESIEASGEARSLTDISLCELHVQAIRELAKTGKPIVALVVNGRPLCLAKLETLCSSIVECWQLGSRAGDAIANVLSGKVNPQGRLSISLPSSTGQCPLYYNHFSTGRPYSDTDTYTTRYLDCSNEPLYPFGYGLSYSEFSCSNMALSSTADKLVVSVDASNTSKVAGIANVQVYCQDIFSKPIRPIKELIGFTMVSLAAHENKSVRIEIDIERLGMYHDTTQVKKVEDGEYNIFVGMDSKDGIGKKISVKNSKLIS